MTLTEPAGKQRSAMAPARLLLCHPSVTDSSQSDEINPFLPQLLFTESLSHSDRLKLEPSWRAGGQWRLCISGKGAEPVPVTPKPTRVPGHHRRTLPSVYRPVFCLRRQLEVFSKLVFSWEIIRPPEPWKGKQGLSEQPS